MRASLRNARDLGGDLRRRLAAVDERRQLDRHRSRVRASPRGALSIPSGSCGSARSAPGARHSPLRRRMTARPAVREIESLGYETLWYPEGLGTRESFTNAAVLLAATDRIRVCSGIANIWARDAVSTANASRVLADAFDDRFLLGLGVSHPRQVDPRGHRYRRPVATMRAYLDAMDDDPFVSPDGPGVKRPPGAARSRRAAAADAPARSPRWRSARTRSSFPSSTRDGHGRSSARSRCSSSSRRSCSATTSPRRASARARRSPGTSTRRTTSTICGGWDSRRTTWRTAARTPSPRRSSSRATSAAIEERCREHLDAGASQVAIQPLEEDDPFGRETFRRLAPVLLG